MSQANHLRAIEPTVSTQISIDSKGGVRSSRFDDIYFYPGKGEAETRYVFINGNNLEERWTRLAEYTASGSTECAPYFCIGELGFGTGLNFLVTTDAWLTKFEGWSDSNRANTSKPTLYFYSTEKYPLTPAAMRKVYASCDTNFRLQKKLLSQYPDPIGGDYCIQFDSDDCRIVLVLLFGESLDGLKRLEYYPNNESHQNTIDAWFLDGFSPPKNQSMWRSELCQQMALLSGLGTTAATFAVARTVCDALKTAGFVLEKRSGFGKKRNMLCASFNASFNDPANRPVQNAIDQSAVKPASEKPTRAQRGNLANCFFRGAAADLSDEIAVIGTGIAGCCTAYQLANLGFNVHVYEKEASIAAGASGNPRAVLFARTASERSMLADLHEAAYQYALNFYKSLGGSSETLTKALNGMAKLGETLPTQLTHSELDTRQPLSQSALSEHAGIDVREGGLFYPQSGYLEPALLCQTLIDHPNITLHVNSEVSETKQNGDQQNEKKKNCWQVGLNKGDSKSYSSVVICCGHTTTQNPLTNWLPIKPIRGQTTALTESQLSKQLKITLCDKGYLTPSNNGMHECGATFNLDCYDSELRESDDEKNIGNSNACLESDILFDSSHISSGRVGFRATSPDYIPMAGPVAAPNIFFKQFEQLASNAKQTPSEPSNTLTGLYVNTAYGSQGFTLAPLVSLVLASYISGHPFPVGENLRQAIAPNRFLLRALIRNKTDHFTQATQS